MDNQLLWYISRATGVLSLTLLTAVMVLGMVGAGRVGADAAPNGSPVRGLSKAGVQRLHRSFSLVALVFLIIHIATAIADTYVPLHLVDVLVPFVADYSTLWVGLGTVAVDLMLAIGITSLIRTRIPRRWWRGIHLAAYALWPIALLHSLFTDGGGGTSGWMLGLVGFNVLAVAIAALVRRRRSRHRDATVRRAADSRFLVGSSR